MANGAILGQTFAPAPLTSVLTLYVDASNGSDSNPGTQSAPFATITAALNSVPKNLGIYRTVINVADGVYNESPVITGFYTGEGSGALRIQGASQTGVIINGGILVSGCEGNISFNYCTINGANSWGSAITILGCSICYASRVTVNGSQVNINPVFDVRFSNAAAIYVEMNGKSGLPSFSIACGTLFLSSISGSGNYIGIESGSNVTGFPGIAVITSNTMMASTMYKKTNGGIIYNEGVLV